MSYGRTSDGVVMRNSHLMEPNCWSRADRIVSVMLEKTLGRTQLPIIMMDNFIFMNCQAVL